MKGNTVKRLSAVLVMALIILSLLPLPKVNAAVKPGMEFDCAYSPDNNTLVVTAYLTNPDNVINSGMFMLKYDKSLLSTDKSKIEAQTGVSIPETTKYLDTSKGYVGADWYPDSSISKSSSKKPIATVTFTVASGKSKSDLESAKAISVCTDTDYLNSIGGYGNDGGVLLCTDSTHTFTSHDSTASSSIKYSDADPSDDTTEKPCISFHGVLSADKETLTVTASIINPVSKTSAAMFVLKYDSTKLSTSKNKVTYLGSAKESKTYCNESSSGAPASGSSITSSNAKYVGADWYYDTALAASSSKIEAVRVVFDVKNNATLNDIKKALAVCDDDAYLKNIQYDDDGGVLICETGTKFFNIKNSTATADFTFEEQQAPANDAKPNIHFHGIYDLDAKTLTVTASICNPKNKVASAMFVLKYDSSVLSITESKVSFLGNARKSKIYSNQTSSGASPANELPSGSSITSSNEKFVGADWYYDTALPASSTETPAVKMVFDVKNNASLDDIEKALAVCDNETYLKSITYGDDGGLLICEDGETFYNAKQSTATASFTYEQVGPTTKAPTPVSDPPTPSNNSRTPSNTPTTPVSNPPKTVRKTTSPESGDPGEGSYPYLFAVLIISASAFVISGTAMLRLRLRDRSVGDK